MIEGAEHLAFRCTACDNCCKGLRVAVTHHDLRRLCEATHSAPAEHVAWLAPDEVDMEGEPASFVELGVGRRLMVLAQENGACHLLGADHRCLAYAARPRDCRVFPFHVEHVDAPARTRLSMLSLVRCDYANDGAVEAPALLRDDAARWRELAEYQELIARWNRLARHRRRLGHRVGSAASFLEFIGFPG